MSELNDLYQEVILDHNKNPRNFREIEFANFKADGHNPLCGDQLKVFLEVEDERVKDVSFVGSGCEVFASNFVIHHRAQRRRICDCTARSRASPRGGRSG